MELTKSEEDVVLCLKSSLKKTLKAMYSMELSGEPNMAKCDIRKWTNRYRVINPPGCTYTSVITFCYGAKKPRQPLDGMIVIFFPETTALFLLDSLGLELESETQLLDSCGEFCNIVSGNLKNELAEKGYVEMEMGTPLNYHLGVDDLFDYRGDKKIEMVYLQAGSPFLKLELAVEPRFFSV